MALPSRNAALPVYHEAGVYVTAALEQDPSTKALAAELLQLEQENMQSQEGLRLARTAQIRAYVTVVWADRKLDNCIRDLSAAAKSADRKQPGLQAHSRLFPSGGYSGLIQPSGRMTGDEVKEVRKLYPNLQDLGAKDPTLLTYTTQLETLCVEAEAALQVLDAADANMEQQYTLLERFRDRWREQAYIVEAELQKLFPGQKDLVRMYFETPDYTRPTSKKDTKMDPTPGVDPNSGVATTPATPSDPTSPQK